MKVLIIQTAYIGDVILSTPIIEKLKAEKPDCTIHFLLKKGNEPLLLNNPHVNKVLVFDKTKNKYINLLQLIKTLRAENYDYVINVNRFFSAGLLTVLSGAKTKIGFDKNPFSSLFTHVSKHNFSTKEKNIHEVDRNLSLLKNIVNTDFIRPKLYPSEEDFKKVETAEKYICIAPATVWFTKQFPVNKWCELIEKLPENQMIYLLGSNSDYILCDTIQKKTKHKRIENMAGKLSLLQSAALIKNARITFANDSTPVHLASSMNAPVAVIYCSTIPEFGFGPLSEISIIVENDYKLNCRPCGLHGKKTCKEKHFKCSDISIDKIISMTNYRINQPLV